MDLLLEIKRLSPWPGRESTAKGWEMQLELLAEPVGNNAVARVGWAGLRVRGVLPWQMFREALQEQGKHTAALLLK